MDPNLFAIDKERMMDVIFVIVLFSFFVERACALLFEHKWFVARFGGKGLKEVISYAVSFSVCRYWEFDALSVILVRERTQLWGHLLTAAIVAGGSKASIKLFHDVLGVKSTAEKARQTVDRVRSPAPAGTAPVATFEEVKQP